LSAITLDATQIVAVLAQLNNQRQLNRVNLRAVVNKWLRRVASGQLPGLNWLVGLLDEATQSARLRMRTDMVLFRKSLHALEGVVGDLGAEGAEIEKTLLREFLLQFGKELPRRWFSAPGCRSFPTRLSNKDLTMTLFNLPLAIARSWQTRWHDFLRFSCGRTRPCDV
jgi:hypothetical protein